LNVEAGDDHARRPTAMLAFGPAGAALRDDYRSRTGL
jgi:hypothetical protein